MPTRLIQLDSHASGTAALHITGPALERLSLPDELEISILQPGQQDLYLDPRNPDNPWSTSVFRFRPLQPRREGAALLLDIDYGVTYHLRANQPYKLKIRQAEGVEVEERFTGSAHLRRPTSVPTGWTPPPDPRGPVPVPPRATPLTVPQAVEPEAPVVIATPTEPAVAAAEPAPERVEETQPKTSVDEPITEIFDKREPKPKPEAIWLALALLLALLVGAGVWWMLRGPEDAEQVAESKPEESLNSIRAFLAGNPDPAAAREKAEKLAATGELLDGQFLLFKYAAERGDHTAARMMGAFYDPNTWAKDKSPLPAPNPIEAARWHKLAAEAGDAESQYRYAMLLRKGGTDEPNGPELAVTWLRKAAEQGNAEAKKALEQ